MKTVYLDVCALCRPYDDQTYTRIHLETTAVRLILRAVENGAYKMVYSPVHEKEISATSDDVEREDLLFLIDKIATRMEQAITHTRKRAENLVSAGFGVADAAHLAYAERAQAFFISCDDKLIKKCTKSDLKIWAGSPIMFCEKEDIK
ncbi:hypothetical protein [Desulfonatronospira sp.]|uniref:hypothetical protein n=1 Tax=Desulfonatronospira sp. TaxID=1962951 RepID=UPI0025C648F8|nr:hypothetical protein [Desulfonatronospira sp.]